MSEIKRLVLDKKSTLADLNSGITDEKSFESIPWFTWEKLFNVKHYETLVGVIITTEGIKAKVIVDAQPEKSSD